MRRSGTVKVNQQVSVQYGSSLVGGWNSSSGCIVVTGSLAFSISGWSPPRWRVGTRRAAGTLDRRQVPLDPPDNDTQRRASAPRGSRRGVEVQDLAGVAG